uniref:Arrestin-like N-terminal domain-containing protein n=1 Tax=Mycena chlorophos TaxID=658473 RepID=A0ABQ0M582_MYCCL|nr:predicted protein [Mycena chlorophos]
MNATTHHAKVKITLGLAKSVYVAGGHITGRMEMECRADKGLGIGVMMVELYAFQELTSRDHSAKSTFIHSRRLFQGPGLPPSNAVQAHPIPGEPPLPPGHHQARRGTSTFLFKFPLPASSPSSISFGGDLAKVRYELRASVGVAWKGEKRLVVDKLDVPVVECLQEAEDGAGPQAEGVVVAENGKIWAQAKVVGGVVVAGESACIELQVKNHSTKKNTGLVVTLTRSLVLSNIPSAEKAPLQISDTLATVPFRGDEYIIPPGAEGVASLVFDVPRHARGVRGGVLYGDDETAKPTHAIFEVQCVVGVKMTMGFGSKDIELNVPVQVMHPIALPEIPPLPPQPVPYPPYADPRTATPYGGYPALPMSPPIPTAYVDPQQSQVWLPPVAHTPQPYGQYYAPHPSQQQQPYFFPPPPTQPVYQPLPLNLARPLSAEGQRSTTLAVPGQAAEDPAQGEEGKGAIAERVTRHLRETTRNRSVSPVSHRYPSNSIPVPKSPTVHSPRPLLSPKASFAADPSSPKSERVEELERMADEVAKKTTNLSGDLPKSSLEPPAADEEKKSKRRSKSKDSSRSKGTKREKRKKEKAKVEDDAEADVDVNKTLPGPPVPSGKVVKTTEPRARIDTYFNATPSSPPSDSALTPRLASAIPGALATPKTPTIKPATRRPSAANLAIPKSSESGLDALERRLLADVGTRKVPQPARPDARAVLAGLGTSPVDIPKPQGDTSSSVDDSAISSLTLAGEREREREREQEEERDRDSDERTQGGAKKSTSGRTERAGGERKSGRKKDKDKERNGRDKAAKGRVAAWLGGIDPDVPPDIDAVPPSPDLGDLDEPVAKAERVLSDDEFKVSGTIKKTTTSPSSPTAKENGSSFNPNPRSSGFVPVKTFKRDPFQRVIGASPADEAKRVADLWASNPVVVKSKAPAARPQVVSPTRPPQSVHTDRKVSPPSAKVEHVLSRPIAKFSPPVDPEVKYDIRSARGGRGGQVTAVASLWASGALAEKDAPKKAPSKPASKPVVAPKPEKVHVSSRPVIKSSSVPAVLSSSLATPTLSSTASLARPPPKPRPVSMTVKPPPTIVESATEAVAGFKGRVQASLASKGLAGPASTPSSPPPSGAAKAGEMAFGQARLRDLIKKYQG